MKKTMMAVMTACAVMLASLTALGAEPVVFEEIPEDISGLELDLSNPEANFLLGAWTAMGDVDENTLFPMYFYAPETSKVCEKSILIVLDSGVKAGEFLAESGWKELADDKNVSLVMVENEEGWAGDENATAKIARAFAIMKSRRYYDFSWDIINLVGYGEGATAAMQYNMAAPDGFASVVLFGGEPVSAEFMAEQQERDSAEAFGKISEIPCPVWIFTEELTPEIEAEVDYWKAANNDSDFVYSSEYADRIYMPSFVFHRMPLDNHNIAQTRLTVGSHVDGTGLAFLEDIYDEFLWVYARHRGIGSQDLRYYISPEDYGMDYYTAEVDGISRSWYVYVPEKVKEAGKDVPLVVAMPGRGGSYSTFASLSDWPQIANEREFICAFPLASMGRQEANGVGNISMWNVGADDVAFLRYLITDVKEKYPIDGGRVYCNGQSMGSMMSASASVTLGDIVTATGSTCGALPMNMLESEHYTEEFDCPVFFLFGELDGGGDAYKLSNSEMLKTMVDYYIERYDLCSVEEAAKFRSAPFNNYLFYNKDHVPMLRYGIVEGKPHANLPSESLYIYDEWFSQFYRDAEGKLHYQDSENVLPIE